MNISPNIIEMVKQHMRVFASNFYIVLVHCPFSRYHFAIIPIYFHQRFVDLSIHISDIRKGKGREREGKGGVERGRESGVEYLADDKKAAFFLVFKKRTTSSKSLGLVCHKRRSIVVGIHQ